MTEDREKLIDSVIEQLKNDIYIYRIKYKDLEGKTYLKTGYLNLLK